MYDTYKRIFDRLNIDYKIVLADTGAIGGSGSHQFMALSDVGESDIIYCDCGYAADAEKAESKPEIQNIDAELKTIEKVYTPKQKSIKDISTFLNKTEKEIVKSLVYHNYASDEFVLVLVRGDREVNEIKIINELKIAEHELALASYDEIKNLGSVEGFVGPVGLNSIKIFVDEEIIHIKNFVVGANEFDYHLCNVNYQRDFTGIVGSFRKVDEGDICPICGNRLKKERGIEVGQIFKLGTKYSLPMNCSYQDENGKSKAMVMGCYGIGVTRTLSSIIEQHHDEYGIIWPLNIAPYHVVIVPINYNDEVMKNAADSVYLTLKKKNVEVILDDRDAKPGFKFKDWELIGIPYIITIGRLAQDGICEFKERLTLEKEEMKFEDAIYKVVSNVEKIK